MSADTTTDTPTLPSHPIVLGFPGLSDLAAVKKIESHVRHQGINATLLPLVNSHQGDRDFVTALKSQHWDAVALGPAINGQRPGMPATTESTQWFNRLLNYIHGEMPRHVKIILVYDPDKAAEIFAAHLSIAS